MADTRSGVPHIKTPSLSVPHIYVPQINVPQIKVPGVYWEPQRPERRHVKDLGDIILGHPITGTRQLQNTLEDSNLDFLTYVPILNRIAGAYLLVDERVVDPLKEGKPGVAFINSLETFGNSLDIVANPIKALIPWAGGGTSDDFLKSMGWADGEYREIYQWDTDNWVADLVGEIVSDPLNWFSIGGKQILKTGSDVLETTVRKTLIKELGQEAAEQISDTTIKMFIREMGEELTTKYSDEVVEEIIRRIDDFDFLAKSDLLKVSPGHPKYNAIKKLTEDTTLLKGFAHKDTFAQAVADLRYSEGYKQYLALTKVGKALQKPDDLLMIASLGITPMFGSGYLVLKKMVVPGFKSIWNNVVTRFKEVDPNDILKNPHRVSKQLSNTVKVRNRAMYKSTYDKFQGLLAKYHTDINHLYDEYISILTKKGRDIVSLQSVNQDFLNWLGSKIPELDYKIAPDNLLDIVFGDIKAADLVQLVAGVSDVGVSVIAIDDAVLWKYKQLIEEDMVNIFGQTKAVKNAQDLTLIQRLNYIEDRYLGLGGFSLLNLKKFLKALPAEKRSQAIALLGYYGINIQNASKIHSLLQTINAKNLTASSNEYKLLEGLIISSKQGELVRAERLIIEQRAWAKHVRQALPSYDGSVVDNPKLQALLPEPASTRKLQARSAEEITKLQADVTNLLSPKQSIDLFEFAAKENVPKDIIRRLQKVQDLLGPDADYATVIKTLLEGIDIPTRTRLQLNKLYQQLNYIYQNQSQVDFIKALEALENYSGGDKTIGELIDSFLAIDLTKGLDDAKLIAAQDSVQKLERLVKKWHAKFLNNEVPKQFDYLRNQVTDLYVLFKNVETHESLQNFWDFLDMSHSYYSLIVSAQGRHNLVSSNIVDSLKDQRWFQALSTPNSDEFHQIKSLIEFLKENPEMLHKAHQLEDIITVVQTNNALYHLMYGTVPPHNIPEECADYLIGEIFNRVYAVGADPFVLYASDPSGLINKILKQFERDNKWLIRKHLYEISPKQNDEVAELLKLEDSLVNGKHLSDTQMDRLQELKKSIDLDDIVPAQDLDEMYNNIMETIEKNLTASFQEYFKTLKVIQDNVASNRTITMYMSYDSSTVWNLRELGQEFDAILKYLVDNKRSFSEITMTTELISMFTELDLKASPNLREFMHNLTSPKRITELTQQQVTDLDSNLFLERIEQIRKKEITTMSELLRDSFSDIEAINAELASGGGKSVLRRLRGNKYYKKMRKLSRLVTVDNFNLWVKENTKYANAYAWSTANGFLNTKKVIDIDFIKAHNLSTDIIQARGIDYQILYNQLQENLKYIDLWVGYTDEQVDKARACLIKFFKNKNVKWGPVSPSVYFSKSNLSDRDVLAWDLLVRQGSISKSSTSTYASILEDYRKIDEIADPNKTYIQKNVERAIDPNAVQTELREVLLREAVTSEDAFTDYILELNNGFGEMIHAYTIRDLKNTIKDVSSLRKHSRELMHYIDADVQAYGNIMPVSQLEKDTRTVAQVYPKLTRTQKKILFSYGITDDTLMNDPKVFMFMKTERCESLKTTIESLNAKQLRSYIDHNTAGMMFFVDAGWAPAFTKEQLSEAGLVVTTLDKDLGIHLIFRTDDRITNEAFDFVKHKYIFNEQQEIITEVFNKNETYFAWEDMQLPNDMYTGDMVDVGVYDALFTHKDVVKQLQPYMNTKSVFKLDKFGNNNFYPTSYSRPNMYIVGQPDAYNTVINYASDHLKELGYDTLPMYSNRLDKSVWVGNSQAIKRTNNKNKYLQLMFNDDFSLDAPWFRHVLDNASDKEIQEMFSKKEFQACILRQNRKGQPTVYKIYITNKASLRKAQEAGAVLLPYEVYRNAVLTINQNKVSSKIMNLYRSTIVGTYKTLYLYTTGQVFRNELDSAIYKNSNTMNGLPSIWKSMQNQIRAAKMYKEYNEVYQYALKLSGNKTVNKYYLTQAIHDLKLTADQRKQFYLLDVFFNSSASPGPTESIQEFLINFNRADIDDTQFAWARWYNENILGKGPMKIIPDLTDQVERTSRLALFLGLVDEGTTVDDAIRKVAATHFDYKLKEPGMSFLEDVFWFSTFPLNNIMYYINEGLTKNPDMLKLQMDMIEQSWNSGPYTWEDVKKSEYLMYNVMTGNQRIYLFGNGENDPTSRLVIKTGSSVFDFFNILANPGGEALNRLNPFISVLTGQEGLDQLNPIQTPVKNIQKIFKGNPIPSVFTQLYEPYRYKKRHYIAKTPYKKSSRWYPAARRRRPSNQSYLRYKFTTSRFYYSRAKGKFSKNWLHTLGPVAPYYGATKPNYRYNRMMKVSNRRKKSNRT